jgi:hypothetical protein
MASRDFLLAWGSANPADTRDAFFSDSGIGRRCLITRVTGPGGDPVGRAGVAAALRANLDGLTAPLAASQLPWTGLAGLHRYLDDLRQRAAAGDREVLADAYAFGWPMQAEAYLHAELLRATSVRWQLPALAGAARRVAAVSHAWTGVRVTAAHGRSDPLVAAGLGRHCERLSRRYDEAVEALAEAAAEVAGR